MLDEKSNDSNENNGGFEPLKENEIINESTTPDEYVDENGTQMPTTLDECVMQVDESDDYDEFSRESIDEFNAMVAEGYKNDPEGYEAAMAEADKSSEDIIDDIEEDLNIDMGTIELDDIGLPVINEEDIKVAVNLGAFGDEESVRLLLKQTESQYYNIISAEKHGLPQGPADVKLKESIVQQRALMQTTLRTDGKQLQSASFNYTIVNFVVMNKIIMYIMKMNNTMTYKEAKEYFDEKGFLAIFESFITEERIIKCIHNFKDYENYAIRFYNAFDKFMKTMVGANKDSDRKKRDIFTGTSFSFQMISESFLELGRFGLSFNLYNDPKFAAEFMNGSEAQRIHDEMKQYLDSYDSDEYYKNNVDRVNEPLSERKEALQRLTNIFNAYKLNPNLLKFVNDQIIYMNKIIKKYTNGNPNDYTINKIMNIHERGIKDDTHEFPSDLILEKYIKMGLIEELLFFEDANSNMGSSEQIGAFSSALMYVITRMVFNECVIDIVENINSDMIAMNSIKGHEDMTYYQIMNIARTKHSKQNIDFQVKNHIINVLNNSLIIMGTNIQMPIDQAVQNLLREYYIPESPNVEAMCKHNRDEMRMSSIKLLHKIEETTTTFFEKLFRERSTVEDGALFDTKWDLFISKVNPSKNQLKKMRKTHNNK